MAKRDVELVIRARDEASRAANAIAETLGKMARAANEAGTQSAGASTKIETLGAMLSGSVEKYRAVSGAVDNATAAYERQKRALGETQAQQAALIAQTNGARAALASLTAAYERMTAETATDAKAKKEHAAKIKLVEQALAALERQQNVVTTAAHKQEAALNEAGVAMQRIGSSATAAEIAIVETAIQRSAAAMRELTTATSTQANEYARLAREARKAQAADDAQRGLNASFGIGGMPKSAAQSGEVFTEQLRLQDQMAASAARIRAQVDPLAAAQARYNVEVAEANALHRAGLLSTDELTRHLHQLETQARETGAALRSPGGGRGERGKIGLFGLKPYEIQNLAYQVNDLFTQVASGTPITQAFAQQGGQIAQIFASANGGKFFAGIASGAARATPAIALVTTALLAVGGALKNIADLSSSQRSFSGLLGASADGGLYNADDLAATAHELDVMGGSLKDARAEVAALVKAGVGEVWIQDMATSAERMAKIYPELGKSADAARQIGEAFTADYEAVEKLDKATNFLTDAQRDHIKSLFDQGKAAEARTEAFRIFEERMNKGAEAMTGRWSHAMKTFGGLWDLLLTKIGDSGPIRSILGLIDELLKKLDLGLSRLARLKGGSALVRAEERSTDLQDQLTIVRARNGGGMPRTPEQRAMVMGGRTRAGTSVDGKTEAQILAEMSANDADMLKYQAQTSDTRAAGSNQGTKEDEDRSAAAAAKAERSAAKAAREAEAAQRARESAVQTLQNALASLESQAGKIAMAPLDARLKAIDDQYKKIEGQIKDAQAKGVTSIDGMSIEDYRKRVEAAKDLLKQQETMKYYSEAMKDLEDQRLARIKAINDQVEDGALRQADAFVQLDALDAEIAPAMKKIADDALRFALALRTAKPSPELDAFIADMQRTAGREAAPGGRSSPTAQGKVTVLTGADKVINDLIAQRNDLIATAETRAERGTLSYEGMQAAIKEAYDSTTPAILEQVTALEGLIQAMRAAGELPPGAFEAWTAKLEGVRLGTENLRGQVLSVADANELLVGTGTDMWDRFFASIEEGKSILSSFWDSLKQGLASVLQEIAQVIMKGLIMRAVMGSGVGSTLSGFVNGVAAGQLPGIGGILAGVFHGGGVVGMGGTTRMAPAEVWANAKRYHSGGLPGLRSDEVGAILQKGEEVLTRGDPRHVGNGGGKGGRGGATTVLNVFDTPDLLDKALATERGEKVMLNFVRSNPGAFKAALGG